MLETGFSDDLRYLIGCLKNQSFDWSWKKATVVLASAGTAVAFFCFYTEMARLVVAFIYLQMLRKQELLLNQLEQRRQELKLHRCPHRLCLPVSTSVFLHDKLHIISTLYI